MNLTRKDLREKLLEVVFEYVFLKEKESLVLNDILQHNKMSDENRQFLTSVYYGVCDNFDALTEVIKGSVKDFSASQIFRLDYAILLIACYELLHTNSPATVVINEAINLAKKYSTDKSGAFINGVLSSVLKQKNGK